VLGKNRALGGTGEGLTYSRTYKPASLVDNSSPCPTLPIVRHLLLLGRVRLCNSGDANDYQNNDGLLTPHPRMRK